MYFKLKVFNPDTDLYGWDYFVSDDNDRPWTEAAKYAEFIEKCGCPIITIDLCDNVEIHTIMEKATRIIDYNEYDIKGSQYWWDGDERWSEV